MKKRNQISNTKNNNSVDIELHQIRESYRNDFIQEVLETLDSIELELVNLEVDPDNGEYLNAVYRDFHTLKGLTGFLEKEIAVRITEATESLLDACRKFGISTTRNIINILLQTILFLRKVCNHEEIVQDTRFQGEVEQHLLGVKQLYEEIVLDVKQMVRSPENKIGEILVEEGAIQTQDIDEVLEKQSNIYQQMKFGEIAVREKKVGTGELIKAIRVQKIRNESSEQYVKIPIQRIDQIIKIVKHLESIQNSLHHESVLRFGSNDTFTAEMEKAEGMSNDIRQIMQELRLVTLQQSFQKLTRAVRAIIEDTGMHVVFSTIGEDIEMNKEIADEIIIPLAEIIDIILSSFPSEQTDKQMGNIEVVAYKLDEKIVIEILGNFMITCQIFDEHKKMDDIRAKIHKLQGSISFEEVEDSGCKVKVVL